jgi:enoyl-CoA hydratase/carnithine racemase
MEMIQIEHHGSVAVVKLARSTTNALNLQLITELQKSLKKVNQDPDVHGIVISSSNEKFFSIGLDIPQLYNLSEKDFMNFYQVFNQVQIDLYTVPKPTVAAITGHAVAGGCILALCCDYRFISEGRKFMGLNEIKLGVSIPYPTDCILRNVVGARVARDIVESGEFYLPEQLLKMGLVDCVLPLEDVLPKSIEKAHMVGTLPLKAFASIKQSRVEQVEAQIREKLKEKEELFLRLWFSDEAREQLRKAMEKF